MMQNQFPFFKTNFFRRFSFLTVFLIGIGFNFQSFAEAFAGENYFKETRLIFYGLSISNAFPKSGHIDVEDNKRGGHFLIFGLEKSFNANYSVSATWQQAIEWTDYSFSSYPVELKYKLNSAPQSLYLKAGVHGYRGFLYEEDSHFFSDGKRDKGFGLTTGVGWQSYNPGGFGYSVEAWVRTFKHFNAVGGSLQLSYGF